MYSTRVRVINDVDDTVGEVCRRRAPTIDCVPTDYDGSGDPEYFFPRIVIIDTRSRKNVKKRRGKKPRTQQ